MTIFRLVCLETDKARPEMFFCQSGEHHDNIFGNYGLLNCKSEKKKFFFLDEKEDL